MSAPQTDRSAPAPAVAAGYCRKCGYSLRGLSGAKCPECGGTFDLADPRSFSKRPPGSRRRQRVLRTFVAALLLALAAASVPAWYWWEWRGEQRVIAQILGMGGEVQLKRARASGLEAYLPDRWAFLRNRVSSVQFWHLTPENAEKLDLGPLGQVEYLDIEGHGINDQWLAQLRGCTNLVHLIVPSSPLDGSGFEHLLAPGRLLELNVQWTRVNDAGLAHIGKLASLLTLNLSHTPVTDAGMAHLAGLTALKELDMDGTAVTDAGLLKLRGLKSLRWIRVRDTKVTEQGKRQLQQFLPNVRFDQ
jgi:hypothetical protein